MRNEQPKEEKKGCKPRANTIYRLHTRSHTGNHRFSRSLLHAVGFRYRGRVSARCALIRWFDCERFYYSFSARSLSDLRPKKNQYLTSSCNLVENPNEIVVMHPRSHSLPHGNWEVKKPLCAFLEYQKRAKKKKKGAKPASGKDFRGAVLILSGFYCAKKVSRVCRNRTSRNDETRKPPSVLPRFEERELQSKSFVPKANIQ